MNQFIKNIAEVRGVLNQTSGQKNYQLERRLPSNELADYVEQYWSVKWDLRGKASHIQQNIPHPCVNMVFEKNNSRIVGLVSKLHHYEMLDHGHIFAVKFHPGGFYPFFKKPLAQITDKTRPLSDIFTLSSNTLVDSILTAKDLDNQIQIIEKALLQITRKPAPFLQRLIEIVKTIESEPKITKTADICRRFFLSARTLQREFNHYLGVSPKWVIRKYRMHQAISMFEDNNTSWQQLVSDLGYFDQAHFIRDFRSMTGVTPGKYFKSER
jgi:AraC-like DNA-binding protein